MKSTREWQGRTIKSSVPPMLVDITVRLPERAWCVPPRGPRRRWNALVTNCPRRGNRSHRSPASLRRSGEFGSSNRSEPHLKRSPRRKSPNLFLGPSAWVVDNLAVVSAATASARRTPLTVESLLEWRPPPHGSRHDPARPKVDRRVSRSSDLGRWWLAPDGRLRGTATRTGRGR